MYLRFTAIALFLACTLLLPITSTAQLSTPEFTFETHALISTSGTTPFWLQSNRHGMVSSEGSKLLTRIQAHSTDNRLTNNLTLSYGADFIARPGTQSTANFTQGYLRLDAYGMFLQAGRFHNTSPIHSETVGMGSLGVSGNAPPIPQIRAGLSDWTSLPFTRDFVQVKFHVAHGWLGSDRFTDDVLYHEKVGHARFGGDFPLNIYGGIAHYALWGGNNNPEYGDLPSRFSDFSRVFRAVGGDETAPTTEILLVLGDHLGGWDFGLFLELEALDMTVYRTTPLEQKDNLRLKNFQDALTGIDVSFTNPTVLGLKKIAYEFLYTNGQKGPRRGDDEDGNSGRIGAGRNYYNHGVYRTGWSYNRRTIGNPLFILRDDNLGIENSRIVAHHIGILFEREKIHWQLKATYSRNYGTWSEPYTSPKNQISYLFKAHLPVSLKSFPSFAFTTEIGLDKGELVGDQIGAMASLTFFL